MSDSPPERVLVDQTRQELLLTLEDLGEFQVRLHCLPDMRSEAAGPGVDADR